MQLTSLQDGRSRVCGIYLIKEEPFIVLFKQVNQSSQQPQKPTTKQYKNLKYKMIAYVILRDC